MARGGNEFLMKICNIFFKCILNYILCHLLESPHRGDFNEMPHFIVSRIGKKISQILISLRLI